ncbi:hypothetical protein AAFC00_005671 [Neodothiora populina]|uniref:Rhodopsin domain-containing protein n=1 Tax=Neodothiora populina TaxID=2781224 RepID=A0ABR3P5F3_9PEZI
MYFNDETAGDVIITVNLVLVITSVLSVAIRFAKPGSPQRGLDLQNFMLALAAGCGSITSIMQCAATKFGLGSHMDTLTEAQTVRFLQLLPAMLAFYYACNMFVKFGLLVFYLRVTYERKYLYVIWLMIIAAFVFGVSNVFVTIFQCSPVNKLWYPDKAGHCLDIMSFYYANAIIMIVNDTIMYVLPIMFTWQLDLRRPQRIVLNLLFGLGAVVVVTSILRLLALIQFDRTGGTDLTYHIASILLWSAIENHTAIFIACSPSIKALVIGTLVPLVSSAHSTVSDKVKTMRSSQASRNDSVNNHNSGRYEFGSIHKHFSKRVSSQHPTRKSMESDNSRANITAMRDSGHAPSVSSAAFSRENSRSSLNKGGLVTAIPLDDLDGQQLPPYVYSPNDRYQTQ